MIKKNILIFIAVFGLYNFLGAMNLPEALLFSPPGSTGENSSSEDDSFLSSVESPKTVIGWNGFSYIDTALDSVGNHILTAFFNENWSDVSSELELASDFEDEQEVEFVGEDLVLPNPRLFQTPEQRVREFEAEQFRLKRPVRIAKSEGIRRWKEYLKREISSRRKP